MPIRIARTKPEEAEILWQLQQRAFFDDIERYHDAEACPASESIERLRAKIEQYFYFTIYDEDTTIGGAAVRKREEGRYRLNRIYIDPGCQNRGYGTRALHLIEAEFPDARQWELDTPHLAFRNHHLYEKLGYHKVGEQKFSDFLTLFEYVKERTPAGLVR